MATGRGGARVLGGELAGRSLRVPPGARPSGGRLREALFSILGELSGSRCLDLFAGSGALGIEALSRGAAEVVFVESDPRAVRTIRRNLEELGRGDAGRVVRGTLPGALAATLSAAPFDLVLADPPYRFQGWVGLLPRAAEQLAPGGILAVEHSARVELPAMAEVMGAADRRRYGESALSLWRRPRSAAG